MRIIRVFSLCIIVCALFFVLGTPRDVSAFSGQQDDQKCVFLSGALAIPDDGSWLQVCLTDPSAPEGSTVTEMNAKVVVDHPDPSQLEIRLTRTDSDLVLAMPSRCDK